MKPGEIICRKAFIELNAGLDSITIRATNTGTRPIQIGSHFHFFEANRFLAFDRSAAFGYRPDIPSGAAIRFEPGEEKEVQLIPIGGKRTVIGLNNLTEGAISDSTREPALKKALNNGFATTKETQ